MLGPVGVCVRIDHHPADRILNLPGIGSWFRMMPMAMPVMGMMMLVSLVCMSLDGTITSHGSPRVLAEAWMLGLPMVARSRV
jgi:branched-subunit amino acid transport protein AzlD